MTPQPGTAIEVRPVPGAPGYSVSACGHVYGLRGTLLQPSVNKKHGGHLSFRVCLEGRPGPHMAVHRAVLLAWVGPCPPNYEARHLDGDPTNNRLTNLRWGTRSENHADRRRHGTMQVGEASPHAKLTEQDVLEMKRLRGTISQIELAARFGVSQATVSRTLNGKRWVHLV